MLQSSMRWVKSVDKDMQVKLDIHKYSLHNNQIYTQYALLASLLLSIVVVVA
jgi:hypothetical protein